MENRNKIISLSQMWELWIEWHLREDLQLPFFSRLVVSTTNQSDQTHTGTTLSAEYPLSLLWALVSEFWHHIWDTEWTKPSDNPQKLEISSAVLDQRRERLCMGWICIIGFWAACVVIRCVIRFKMCWFWIVIKIRRQRVWHPSGRCLAGEHLPVWDDKY